MVPFPEHGADETHYEHVLAARYLGGYPDGKGIFLPPVRRETLKIWNDIAWPDHHKVRWIDDSTKYGFIKFYLKGLVMLKHNLAEDVGNSLFSTITRHVRDKSTLKDWEKFDVNTALKHVEGRLKGEGGWKDDPYLEGVPWEKRMQLLKDLRILLPHMKEAADILGEYAKRVVDEKRAHGHIPAYVLLEKVIEKDEDPRIHFYRTMGMDAIKKLHKFHRLYYEMLKPISKVVFEKPSGWEDFLDEADKQRIEEEVRRILAGGKPTSAEQRGPQPVQQRAVLQARRPVTPPPRSNATPRMKKNPLEVRKEKERFTIDDVDMSKVEKHPETGLPIIRNGDQIVVLPPHKHPKEIPNLHPEATAPKAYNIIALLTNYTKDPEKLEKAATATMELIRKYREYLAEGDDIKAIWKIRDDIKEYKKRYTDDATRHGINYAAMQIEWHNDNFDEIKGYSIDHALSELAVSEVQMKEAEKLVKDLLNNPEKYGLGKKDIDYHKILKVLEEHFHKKGKVVGFAHTERVK